MRSPFLALVVGLTLSATSQAQTDPFGTIHYTQSPSLYRISGASNSVPSLVAGAPDPAIRPTDLKYDGRHRYFTLTKDGTMPVTGQTKGDFYLWDEATGGSIKLTAFAGPNLYTPTGISRTRWSNDRQDTFFSFYVEEPATGVIRLVRTRVTAATPNWGQNIVAAGAGFVPFDETDLLPGGRLEVVASWNNSYKQYTWSPAGDVLYYLDLYTANGVGRDRIRAHPVGDTPMDQDPVLFDEVATGIRVSEVDVSPTTGMLAFYGETVKVARNGSVTTVDPTGYIMLSPLTGAWSWSFKSTTAKAGFRAGTEPLFAPDGTGLCFWGSRLSSGKVVASGLYKLALSDGSVATIREATSGSTLRRWTR